MTELGLHVLPLMDLVDTALRAGAPEERLWARDDGTRRLEVRDGWSRTVAEIRWDGGQYRCRAGHGVLELTAASVPEALAALSASRRPAATS